MIAKTLQITQSLFEAAPQIKRQLAGQWPPFLEELQRLHLCLARGPNPEFNEPLITALNRGFHSSAERIIFEILEKNAVDYRFITGRRRYFKTLLPGKKIPEALLGLWGEAFAASTEMMNNESVANNKNNAPISLGGPV